MLDKNSAMKIAKEYADTLGVSPFVVDGSVLRSDEDGQYWLVFLRFIEDPDEDPSDCFDLPDSMMVRVDLATGEPSHTPHL